MNGTPRRYEGFVPGRHPIDAYGAGGFRFADMSHRGSILVLPSGIYAWTPSHPGEIVPDSLAPLYGEAPDVEHLLVGTGPQLVPLGQRLLQRLKDAGIRAEPMPTHAAAMTYNIMFGEGRRVAAALLAVL